MGQREDYHGYFEAGWESTITDLLSDMLITIGYEANAPAFGQIADDFSHQWTMGDPPITLLNQAWRQVRTAPAEFARWEEQAMRDFLTAPDSS